MKISCGPHVKCMILLFNFGQIWIFPTDLNKRSQNQISCTSIKWEPRWYMWKNRTMKGQTKGLTGTFCMYASMCKTHLRYNPFFLQVLQFFDIINQKQCNAHFSELAYRTIISGLLNRLTYYHVWKMSLDCTITRYIIIYDSGLEHMSPKQATVKQVI